jgi:quercetin dioxygenase-like cupin family protein
MVSNTTSGDGAGGSAAYFESGRGAADPNDRPAFVNLEAETPRLEAAPGVFLRPVFGKRLSLSYVEIEPNSEAPLHDHAEEQIGLILEGSCRFELAGETRVLKPGDVYVAPPFVPHGAWTDDESCRILDVFSPPREAFRILMAQQGKG